MPKQTEQDGAKDSSAASDRHVELTEGELEPDSEIELLVAKLERGSLTHEQQQELSKHLQIEPAREQHLNQRVKQTSFIGPLPHPDILNQFDEETRKIIVQMAVRDQEHVHEMNRKGLSGNILKDRIGQFCGLTIALGALWVAFETTSTNPGGALMLTGFSIVGMVAVFVAPRALEAIANHQKINDQSDEH